ncbi:hypothetical protein, partial [Akkermansia sp.]|uniref:hypothetical protein n=1 Tax=Akkermansia sp. TaxID=1872421 RepID=UPI003AB299C3
MEGLRRGILEMKGPYMKLIVLVNPWESMECQEFCLPIKKRLLLREALENRWMKTASYIPLFFMASAR